MNEKTQYTEAPKDAHESIERGNRIIDFLPPPDQLVKKTPKVKVTITLNSRSIDFFKRTARQNNVKYQTMINEVLDQYVNRYSNEH